MPGQRRANRDIRRFPVANFADHDHVRILAHDVPQALREGQPDLRIHMDLIDPVHLILDRVFNRDDLLVGLIDALQCGIERSGFSATRRPRDHENAVRERSVILHAPQHVRIETQLFQIVEIAGGSVEQTHHDALSIQCRQCRNAQIHLAPDGLDLDASILGQAPLRDIQPRHQFHAADDSGLHLARRRILAHQHSVNSIPDAELFFERLNVDVARTLLGGHRDHRVHQPDHRSLAGHVAQVLQVFRFGRLRDRFGFVFRALSVVAVDRVQDFLLPRERGLHSEPRARSHRGASLEIQRIGHRQGDRVIVLGRRQAAKLA